MSESNSDNKETMIEEAVAKKPVAAKKATTAKKATATKTKADDVADKKPKVAKKATTPKKVVATKEESKTDSEVPTPVVATDDKEEKSYNTYYAIAASVLIAVVLSVLRWNTRLNKDVPVL